jgi:hypothetical protein
MNFPPMGSLTEFLESIETNTLIISSHHWPRGIDFSCGGKTSLLTVFDLNLEAAGIFTLHQIAAAIDLFDCREIVLFGHFPGKLRDECLQERIWDDYTVDALVGMSKGAHGDGFSIRSEKLVQAAVFLQVQYQYLKFFLDRSKWKNPGKKPSLHAMILGEDEVVYPLEEIEKENAKLPINYVLN